MALFDPEAEPDSPLPDRVPDELVARYGAKARRAVRVSRSWRYPLTRRFRRVKGMLRSGDLWLLTLLVFAWSVVAAGAVGALVYAAVMFPWAGLFVVLPGWMVVPSWMDTSSMRANISGMPRPCPSSRTGTTTLRRKMPVSRTRTSAPACENTHCTSMAALFVWRMAFAHASDAASTRSSAAEEGKPSSSTCVRTNLRISWRAEGWARNVRITCLPVSVGACSMEPAAYPCVGWGHMRL